MKKQSKSKSTTLPTGPSVRVASNVSATNQVLGEVRNSRKKLFEVVKDAYAELSTKEFKEYRDLVDLDPSTFNKVVKVIENDTISKFMDQLPISWGSLYALTSIDKSDLVSAIEDGKIHRRSTLADIRELKGKQSSPVQQKGADKEISVNTCWVDLDELNLSNKERMKITALLGELRSFGIEITGVDPPAPYF